MKINKPVTNVEREFPDGKYIVSRTDLKGIITYADDTFVEISGFSREELIGKSHNIVRHPDMLPAAFAWAWDTIKADRPWRGMVKNRSKNGDFYWVDALIVPVLKDGRKVGYMSVRTKPSRKQIADAEALYRKLADGSASIPKTTLWARIPLQAKFAALVIVMILAQLLGVGMQVLGPDLGLTADVTGQFVMLFGVAGIAAALGLLTFQRGMMVAFSRITSRLQNIAQGDLTDEIPLHRVDELGKLNDALITMQTHLRAMMAEIAEQSTSVDSHIHYLSREIDATRRTAAVQSEAANSIAASVEEMVASVDRIAEDAQQASQAVQLSRNLLEEATQRMQQSQQASEHVVVTVRDAGHTMDELFQSISAIERVSQVIRDIADQTNLLALNAAIEAARAGESGRGFAVVADEVRKLAENSSKQTGEITASIQHIQGRTQSVHATMAVAGTQVETVNATAETARNGLHAVVDQGERIHLLAGNIATGTRQQVSAGGEIAQRMEDIVSGIGQTSNTIQEVAVRSNQIQQATGRLRELIGYFRFIR
ncbi:methyl-accepting chemotaxis protein [Thauera sp. Sel9]|uniref:methyl-accepting chemotaxis protein n=1 Tax=Thauera sp. Sel9 TaxID=2974299 RepID=UPI0021E10EB5|nr:PAS domain-containing methyl-accepting chemotaxis protein [Thauera sp. Sel9]MCV2217710.1 PAS domain-containing methyl-accepting chemotaxis protein [Thauera sp. Sel9]